MLGEYSTAGANERMAVAFTDALTEAHMDDSLIDSTPMLQMTQAFAVRVPETADRIQAQRNCTIEHAEAVAIGTMIHVAMDCAFRAGRIYQAREGRT